MSIPETAVRKDWPRLVKNAIDGILKRLGAVERAGVVTTRAINTTAPLTGGGDLTVDRTLAITAASAVAAGSMSAADKTKLDAISGTNTGDQTITLTGPVTGSGTGTFATAITDGSVTLAKQANMATASVVYRKTAGAGPPEVQTLATLKADLGLSGTNTGDQDLTPYAPKASPTFTGTITYADGVGTTLALGGTSIGTDKFAVSGTTTFSGGKTTFIGGQPFRFRNATTDGFDVSQINVNSWSWTGLSGGMWLNLQNAHFIIGGGNLGIRTAVSTNPAAMLEIGQAGGTSLAPLKLKATGAALLTTPVEGTIETDGTDLYWTNAAGTRKKVTLV